MKISPVIRKDTAPFILKDIPEGKYQIVMSEGQAIMVIAFIDPKLLKPSKYQPRIDFDVENFKKSLRDQGITTELQVNEKDNGDLVVVDGHRRRLCAIELQGDEDEEVRKRFKTVPIIIKKLTEQEEEETVLIDNIKRKDFNKIEIARALQNYKSHWGDMNTGEPLDNVYLGRKFFPEFSQKIIKGSTSASLMVGRYLRLLELPEEVQKIVADDGYAFNAAYQIALLKFDSDEEEPEDWKRRRMQHQLELAKSQKPYTEIASEVSQLKKQEKLIREQIAVESKKRSNLTDYYFKELQEAIKGFTSRSGIAFPVPNTYTDFRINDLMKEKDKILNELQAQRITEEQIAIDKQLYSLLEGLLFVIPKSEFASQLFDEKELKTAHKDLHRRIETASNKNDELDAKIQDITLKYGAISQTNRKILKLLFGPSEKEEGETRGGELAAYLMNSESDKT
jgi:ParB/RepB/Spo0J family partition protein